ncbi:alpha-ketoacid dehydrogenase kinase [Basidiobolus meristosporus CBS 931.73]|uniref:Protein-serine/threonine kinase n=1 Tax=Basidiobolus meristosporus CBS 931.73 TaxID=1314790 RepID=A0A1Y1XBV9_9FUNG|nr:alpha-ketoacid dehydrogenase kinase [Basidiobolus meristosporus CBS 931.73]|eukprot:ORX83202.1 alpha-ketoacid dehydrogenase kinase [Basidiobolus meristosporus CBS 931.73]
MNLIHHTIFTTSRQIRNPQTNFGNLRRYYNNATNQAHFYNNRVLDKYLVQPTRKLTLRQLVFYGRHLTEDRVINSGNYVRTELPVRIAHRIRDMQNLPFITATNPHLETVYNLYWHAFDKFRKVPKIQNMNENRQFCELLKSLLEEHLSVIPKLAMFCSESSQYLAQQQLDQFMNEILRSRISRRVLAEQHIAISDALENQDFAFQDDHIGIVSPRCAASEIVKKCADLARSELQKAHGTVPRVRIDGHVDTIFPYIPDHVEYIVHELLKNSIAAVIKKHGFSKTLPDIVVTICEGEKDVIFRVSDEGGGINQEELPKIWSYGSNKHKAANFEKVPKMAAKMTESSRTVPPLLQLGIGLPMSKVYANYWGGDLEMSTMEGFGTDAYLHLCKLGNLPENIDFDPVEGSTTAHKSKRKAMAIPAYR